MASVAPAARDAQLEAASCHESAKPTDIKQNDAGPVAQPDGQRQSADPAALYLPAGQGAGAEAPAGHKEPAGQGVQEAE